jgi:hypothetical protein
VTDDFWENRFHWCALAAGFLAAAEGRLNDDEYVKKLAYEFYETGAFRDRTPVDRSTGLRCNEENKDANRVR